MIISVASGKGGTGKTTVAVNLALAGDNIHFLDCDVEEPNSAFFLKPEIISEKELTTLFPEVDKTKCDFCGKCAEVCAYRAINVFKGISSNSPGEVFILPHLCHNCGACAYFCPKNAIKEVPKKVGVIQSGRAGDIEYSCGLLDIGEIKTPFLIKELKKKAIKGKNIIIDAPPGASCPMTAAVKNSDFCLMVTEPTPFGLNDLEIAVEAVKKMDLPFAIVINRWDGNSDFENILKEKNLPVIEKIPFDRTLAENYSRGVPAVSFSKEYRKLFRNLFLKLKDFVKEVKI